MRILLVNDDGIEAEGIRALAEELAGEHEVVLAAPAQQQSGMAHALTVHRDLEVASYEALADKGIHGWKIDGTPTDCVKVYLEALCEKDNWPELVISGINHGANLGSDVLYSAEQWKDSCMESFPLRFHWISFLKCLSLKRLPYLRSSFRSFWKMRPSRHF